MDRSKFVGILAVGILTLATYLTVWFIGQEQQIRQTAQQPQQESIQKLTDMVIQLSQDYKKAPNPEALKELEIVVEKRKELIEEKMVTDPKIVLDNVLAQSVQNGLPEKVQEKIEDKKELEGKLFTIHIDDIVRKKSKEAYILETKGAKHYIVHFAENPPNIEDGSSVKVEGIAIEEKILVDDGAESNAKSTTHPAKNIQGVQSDATTDTSIVFLAPPNVEPPTTIGPQRVAVILAHFQNVPQPSITKEQIRSLIFTETNSYFKEASYNKTNLTGDVFGWYSIPVDQTCSPEIDLLQTEDEAVKAADPFVNFGQYERALFIVPFGACPFGGYAIIGSKLEFATNDGFSLLSIATINSSNCLYYYCAAHELGHNLGLNHAQFVDCGESTFASTCSIIEYGDEYDPMGFSGGHYSAANKEFLDWFDSSNIRTVWTSGTYVIEPLENASGAVALKIRRGLNDYMYVEYRQAQGFDRWLTLTGDVFTGALVHIKFDTDQYGLPNDYTYLIDPSPPTSINTIALTFGNTLVDPATGTTIRVTGKTSNALIVQVTLGAVTLPPTVTITSPKQNSNIYGTTTIEATVSDTADVSRVDFYDTNFIAPVLLGSDTQPPYTTQYNINSYQYGSLRWLYAIAYSQTTGSLLSYSKYVEVAVWPGRLIPTTIPTSTPSPTEMPTDTPVPTATVAISPTSALSPTPGSNPDVNSDGCLDILDFNIWLIAFIGGTTPSTFKPDIDNNGSIDILDFNLWYSAMRRNENSVVCTGPTP